jgi:hypothetical protein
MTCLLLVAAALVAVLAVAGAEWDVADDGWKVLSDGMTVDVTGGAVPEEKWNVTFGGTDWDVAYSVQQTLDGGYILAGGTCSYSAGEDDAWLVKTDSDGNEIWNKTFGGTMCDGVGDGAHSVQQTLDGGYIFAGYTMSYGTGSADFWLVKTDSDGNEIWNKTFGGTDWDWASTVQQTSDGGYVLEGYTESYGAGSWDFWLVKTDSNGNEQWNKTFGGTGEDRKSCAQQTTDDGYIIAGYTESYGVGQGDFWLVKTDSNGNEQWNKTFGGTGWDVANSVQQTSDGGYILAGWTCSYGAGHDDAWLVKTDSNGNEMWNKTFGGSQGDGAHSVQQTSDSGYIIAGYLRSHGAVVKTDSDGKEMWNKTFGNYANRDHILSVQQTADGDYILAGCRGLNIASFYDARLIKLGVDTPRGDLNHDNQITPADAAIALRIAATGAHDDAADVSRDGRVTSLDALMIMQAAGGRIKL